MEICKNQVVIIITIIFSIIIVISFMSWSYMWEDEFISKWASLITILSVIGVPIAYFSNQNKKEQERKQEGIDERNRASSNLHRELQDTIEALDRAINKENALSFIKTDGKEVFFMNRTLNHDFYDSLIFSGKINFLRPELQQQIQNIFRQIKTHNKYVNLVMNMKDETDDGIIPEKAYKYYEWLDENEVKLLEDIPTMKIKLSEDFDVTQF